MGIVIHMCGLFHQRYADFMGYFITELMKMFENYNSKDEEKVRVQVFFLALRASDQL